MGLSEIQEIGKIVAQAGGTAREVFIWYIVKDLFAMILFVGAFIFTVHKAFKVVARNDTLDRIARAYDGTSYLNKSNCDEIVKHIQEWRQNKY